MHAPLKVMIVADHIGGGTGQHILSLLAAFDPARALVTVVSEGRVHSDVPAARLVRRMPRLPILHRFPFAHVHSLSTLKRYLRREPVDVLHTYGLWPVLYGRFLKRAGVVRHLVENREDDGHIWGTRWYWLLRATRRIPDRVIAVSRSVAGHVGANEQLDDPTLLVIENGATRTEARFDRAAARELFQLPPNAFVVGAVASNIDRPVKGIRYLIEAFPAIRQRVPGARLLLLGDRLPDSSIVKAIAERDLSGSVVLGGYRDDVADLYPAMDVLVMPSLSEGLPIALLEAMRHGVPAVATRVGGTPEVLVDEVTGFLVAPEDPRALADRVIAVATDPVRREAMGRAASARYEDVFDITHVARRYEETYLAAAEGGRTTR